MTCPQCGTETPAALERCRSCGAPLGTGPSAGANPSRSRQPVRPSSEDVTLPGVQGGPEAGADTDDTINRHEAFTADLSHEATGFTPPRQPAGAPPAGRPTTAPAGVARTPPPPPTPAQRIGASDFAATSFTPADDAVTGGVGSSAPAPGSTANRSRAGGPLEMGESFGPRYHIIRLLGVGGMGAVYQAWDAELGVAVALKVIRPEVAADPTAARDLERRFKRELLLARQVTHKNVVRIHDLGEIDGIKYITMPYVEGDDLSTILARDGKLPVPRVLRIARTIVAGLAAAHEAGVVHRDLKPANIMVGADDEALIMDFGIARSSGGPAETSPSPSPGPAALPRQARALVQETMSGAIVGTVQYMAPEQARGQTVDQRADIYAFGLILYDMIVGKRRAAHAQSAVAELQARLQQPPPPVRTIEPGVPEPLEDVISRCIESDAAKRYPTTVELAAALDRLDDEGRLKPLPRRLTLRMIAVAALAVLVLVAGAFYTASRLSAPPKQHEPVSVLIADFENTTNDPALDRTLEPVMKLALEGAGFISAYDRTGLRALGARAGGKFDERAAVEIAAKQAVGVVVTGKLERQGDGYAVSVKAAQTVTGDVIAQETARAPSKDKLLEVATRLAAIVRNALGDETANDSAQMYAMASLSATSLDVLRHYAAAREASSNGKFEEALRNYSKAVELDPKFGIGYQGLATVSLNLGNLQDAEKYFKEALSHLDGMTERERYNTRGVYYRLTGDFEQCEKEYTDLIARFDGDVLAHNNLALCSALIRNLPKAISEMRRAVEILPKRALFRINLSLYSSYGGDFQTGEQEARSAQELASPLSLLPLAFAQAGQGRLAEAGESYRSLGKVESLGPVSNSWEASGLADLAIYEGRFAEAVRMLEAGAAADRAAKSDDRAAAKLVAIAYAQLSRGRKTAAIAAAERALATSKAVKIRFLAGRILIESGQATRGRTIAAGLASELQADPQAHAKILDGLAALRSGDRRQAIKSLSDATATLNTWIGHFDLGRAYLEAGQYPQADSAFDRCIKRRGEALSLFLDEEPTFGYLPAAYYYQGRVREELKSAGFADSYNTYLEMRGRSTEDPLVPEVRKRVAARSPNP